MYFQQKEPIKVQICWNFTWAAESLKFCILMGSCCSFKVLAKKVQKSYLSWHWRLMQSLKKNLLVISNMTWGTGWILTRPTTEKSKNFFSMAYFCPKYMRFELKKYRSHLSWHWTVMQNLNKPWPCGFKNGIRNWVNFH